MSTPVEIPAEFANILYAHTGVFATLGPDGYPQMSATAFLAEHGVIKTSVHPSRQKYKNAVREGKAAYLVLDPAEPLRGLEVRGDISVEDDPDLDFLRRQAVADGQDLDGFTHEMDNRKVLVLTPTRVRTWDLRH